VRRDRDCPFRAASISGFFSVTPEHVVPQVIEAVALAVQGGLRLPIVYNTSAYDSLQSLRLLDGVVDIYMPGECVT
jgi:putative pyruvate formate lyase activating enzyme